MIEYIGTACAVLGSTLACYGVWVFNVKKDPATANILWAFSNPILFVWAVGYIAQAWDGLMPITVLAGMYGYYTVASWWGLSHV
jgi:hypothetical protein